MEQVVPSREANEIESRLALCLDQIDHDQEVTLPLEQGDRDLLMSIYEEAGTLRQIRQHEQVYSSLDFQTLRESKSTPHLKPLWELEEALRKETRPAFIADSLWFMHALNGATFNLFGIVPPGLGRSTDHGKYLTRCREFALKFERNQLPVHPHPPRCRSSFALRAFHHYL